MNILGLRDEHFVLHGQRKKLLSLNLRGNVLVCFKMTGDANCKSFDPIFAQLSRAENRVQLAVLDVKANPGVVKKSRESNTPISAVPALILYVEGRAHAKFNGARNLKSLQGFIGQALAGGGGAAPQAPQKQTFMPQAQNYGQNNNNYAQPQQNAHSWKPEIGKPPNLKGVIKGAGGYAVGNNVEEEDEMRLMIPDQVVPHNTPWETGFPEEDELN